MPTYTLYGATYANGDSVSKSDVENGTGSAVDTFSRSGSTLSSVLTGAPSLTTAITNADIAIFIRETDTSVESNLYSENVGAITVGAAFTPADLFASSEAGAWYDVHPDYCWTDSVGGTNATVGDTVAALSDRSGNGNHATQATSTNRPTLRQDGSSNYYLEFDGVNDALTYTTFAATGDFSLMAAAIGDIDATSFPHANIYADSAADAKLAAITTTRDFFFRARSGESQIDTNVTNWNTTPAVLLAQRSSGSTSGYFNAGSAISGVSSSGTTAFVNIGGASPQFGNIDFYGGILINRVLTTGERADAFTFLGNKCGLSL